MVSYIPKLVKYLKTFRKSPKTKDLLGMLREWTSEFEKEALYDTYINHNKAKHKYILMKWSEWEHEKNRPKPSRPIRGNYEDEELGMWYCGGERVKK